MQVHQYLYALLAFITTCHALALPALFADLTEASRDLFKRKGGGGGGRGGGSSSSSSSSSGSRGGSSSSGSSSSGSSSSSPPSGGSSRSGGSSTTGSGSSGSSRSGSAPRYGSSSGGGYYGGGAAAPYRAGPGVARSGVAPILLGGAALGALAVLPGIWLYGAYAYNFNGPYSYYNRTANRNESHPITCLCGENADCGCDANNDQTYLDDVANNGDVARLANVNGTQRLVVNGTVDDSSTTASGAGMTIAGVTGYWPVIAGVVYSVLLL